MYQASKFDIMRKTLRLIDVYDLKDYRTLYELLEERTPNQSISHALMPSFEDHKKFVDSHPYLAWYYIICNEGTKVGSIYLTLENEIGIAIFKQYKDYGFASMALGCILNIFFSVKKFKANINPKNSPSINFFKKHGFRPLQTTYVLERD